MSYLIRSKRYIGVFVIGVLILIALIFAAEIKEPSSPTADKSAGTIIPTQSVFSSSSGSNVISKNQEFDDYKRNASGEFSDTNIPNTSPIKNVHFESKGTTPPVQVLSTYDVHLSPSKFYETKLTNSELLIYLHDSNSLQRKVPFKVYTNSSSAVWITDDIILLIEKDPESPHIDSFYAIDRKTGKKTYLIGSFPIPSRLNLNVDPYPFNDGHSVLLKDNDGNYWQMDLLL